jgi:hypothetical protein
MEVIYGGNSRRDAPHCLRYYLTVRVERTPIWIAIDLFWFLFWTTWTLRPEYLEKCRKIGRAERHVNRGQAHRSS